MNLRAGGVTAGVHDPGTTVAALQSSRQRSVVVTVEASPVSDEFGKSLRSFLDQRPNVAGIAESRARDVGVAPVVERIVLAVRGRDATLRPGRAAVAGAEQEHIAGRRETERG